MKRIALIAASFCFTASAVFGGSITELFPTTGDGYVSATNGSGTIPIAGQAESEWTSGDSVTSAVFLDVPSASVTGITENWTYKNYLSGGASETWNILLNGTIVGSETLLDCGNCQTLFTLSNTINFSSVAPVSGGYQVSLVLANTVTNGLGSVAWLGGGTTTLTYADVGVPTTPEPTTTWLVASGLAVVGFTMRKRLSGN
jgi:hypothetical protein